MSSGDDIKQIADALVALVELGERQVVALESIQRMLVDLRHGGDREFDDWADFKRAVPVPDDVDDTDPFAFDVAVPDDSDSSGDGYEFLTAVQ